MQLLLSAAVLLLSLQGALAAPIDGASELVPRALHPCSVEVQRWCLDCGERFDASYYDAKPTAPFTWKVGSWWTQTSSSDNTPSVGSELVPIPAGSHVLHIFNVANQANANDPGKLRFVWGSQTWDSYSAGTPCISKNTNPGGSYAWDTQCTFQCDHVVGHVGPNN